MGALEIDEDDVPSRHPELRGQLGASGNVVGAPHWGVKAVWGWSLV